MHRSTQVKTQGAATCPCKGFSSISQDEHGQQIRKARSFIHGAGPLATGAYEVYTGAKSSAPMIARFLIFCLLVVLIACEEPLRLPYITPELHNWPKSYRGVRGLRLHVFHTGTIEVPGKLVYRRASILHTHTLDILVFVIEHPRHGLILVGTGLNRNIAVNPQRYLGVLLTTLGNPAMEEGQDILSQLKKAKLSEKKVRYLILPDLRLDHTGEVESFAAAQVVVATAEHTEAIDRDGVGLYLSQEYDNVREWRFIDFAGAKPLGTFRAHKDLFDDGSVLLIDVTGATAGGLAVLVRLPTAPVLLCGNLAWTQENYLHARLPGLLFDREAWWEKVWRLKKFKDLVPALVVLPDHDWAAVEAARTKDMLLHSFSREEAAESSPDESSAKPQKTERQNQRQRKQTLQRKTDR